MAGVPPEQPSLGREVHLDTGHEAVPNVRRRLFLSEVAAIGMAVLTLSPLIMLSAGLTPEEVAVCLQATLLAAVANIAAAYVSLDRLTRPIRALFSSERGGRAEGLEEGGQSLLAEARAAVLNLPAIFTLTVLLRYSLSAIAVSAAMPIISTLSWEQAASLAFRTCIGLLVPMMALFFLCERILEPVRREIARRGRSLEGEGEYRVIRMSVRRRLFLAVTIMVVYPLAVLFSLYYPDMIHPEETPDPHTLWLTMSAVFGVSLSVATGVTLLLARSIAEPLVRTARIMDVVGAGNLDVRVDVLTSDETGMLGERFNQMVDQLDESQDRLQGAHRQILELNRDLKLRVEELSTLNDLATRLAACTSPGAVLDTGLAVACRILEGSGGLAWSQEATGLYSLVRSRDLDPSSIRLAEGLAERHAGLLQTGQMVRSELQDAAGPSQLLLIPLISHSTAQGALGVVRKDGHSWNDSSLAIALGAQVGVALESARRYEDAKNLADRDPVTGLLNHRALHERLEGLIARKELFSLVLADLDSFRLFNDTHGHPAGDEVLRSVAAVMKAAAGEEGIVGRYGADAFALMLPHTDGTGARAVAEAARSGLAETPYVTGDGTRVPLRLSFGISTYPDSARRVNDLVGFADANLHESKSRGGDAITGGKEQADGEQVEVGGFGVLDGLVTAIDHKDHYTRKHSEEVTEWALALGQRLGLSDESLRVLRMAGLLHDVGKIGVPDRILRKPGRLDPEEFAIIQQHAMLGELIIKGVPKLPDILAAVGSHHEKLDGTGYPRGLKGDEIPYLGRIIAVADVYSAMTSDRPYRKAMSKEEALAELERIAGSHLDPKMVKAFCALMRAAQGDNAL